MVWLIFIVFFIFIFWTRSIHLHIDFKSFLKKGFKKVDNAYGLFVYTGKQGYGKTYSAIKFLIDQKQRFNYRIITNVLSFNTYSDTLFMTDINDIIDYCSQFNNNDANVIIFFDEIFTILEKRGSINSKILGFISQLRKRNIIMVTTAQEWLEINMTFRRYARYQVDCHMISLPFSKNALQLNYVNDAEQMKWSNDDNEYVAPRLLTKISKGNKSIIESYDTFETIKRS